MKGEVDSAGGTSGKLYRFTAGSTQTVTGSLTLLGAAGNLLGIRSTVGGSEAWIARETLAGVVLA